MSIHDITALRRAAADLAYCDEHGLLADLREWLACHDLPRDPDRRWRIEHGRTARIAEMLASLTGADDDTALAATCAAIDPDSMTDRPRLISEFAAAHRRHGSGYRRVLWAHLTDALATVSPTAPTPAITPIWRTRQGGAA